MRAVRQLHLDHVAGAHHAGSSYPASFPTPRPAPQPLNDVTSGNDGSCSTAYLCTARSGYDGPTGWGAPEGISAFTG